MKNKPTSEQLVDMLEDNLDITICADVVHGLDLEYKQLQEENKELKMCSDDQIRVKCPNCGEGIIVNECRAVWELKEKINKAIEFINEKKYFSVDENAIVLSDDKIGNNDIEDLLKILKGETNEK